MESEEVDVEYIGTRKVSKQLKCQLCPRDLTSLSIPERQAHYDTAHRDTEMNEPQKPKGDGKQRAFSSSSKKPPSKIKMFLLPTSVSISSRNIFWYSTNNSPPPLNITPDLIPLLRTSLLTTHSRGTTDRAWLCDDLTVHIQSEPWDRGWGCGYRNFLMACAALITQRKQPLYFPLLDEPLSPGVYNLQLWIEDAWTNGYDSLGAEQLGRKLVDTTKWIGTAELYVAFTSRGIPANLVDFALSRTDPTPMINWIEQYFSQGHTIQPTNINDALRGASPVVGTKKMPLILQHAGHSRTVVGIEKGSKNINLLVFDPSRRVPEKIRDHALSTLNVFHGSPVPNGSTKNDRNVDRTSHTRMDDLKGKRRASRSPEKEDTSDAKRLCSSRPRDIIVIDSDSDTQDQPSRKAPSKPPSSGKRQPEADEVLKVFRVKSTSLTKEKYQILYFPLTDPLNESQKRARRVVTSVKVS